MLHHNFIEIRHKIMQKGNCKRLCGAMTWLNDLYLSPKAAFFLIKLRKVKCIFIYYKLKRHENNFLIIIFNYFF